MIYSPSTARPVTANAHDLDARARTGRAVPVGEICGGLFDRGTLPLAVMVARRIGPLDVGRVLHWSDALRGYEAAGVNAVVRAGVVRVGLGVDFLAVPTQADLFPASEAANNKPTEAGKSERRVFFGVAA
jgi:hypothetical protein